MKNIYLDIDGTILLDDLKNLGRDALHLGLFLSYLGNLQDSGACKVCWLTTHCMDGLDERVLSYLRPKLNPHDYDLITGMRIQPTAWSELKTEAIDFSTDFLWLDDDATLKEKEILYTHNAEHKLIEMDLQKDKHQLKNIVDLRLLDTRA